MRRWPVTVVVPLYNRRRVIADALAGVAAQTLPPDRLVVVDDGSTDGGAEVARRWFARCSARTACHLIAQSNQGVSAARNRGLSLAADDGLVAFLDSDDVWPDDFLERTVGALAAQPHAVAVSTDRCILKPGSGDGLLVDASGLPSQPAMWMLEHGGNLASSSLFRVLGLRRHGGFDPARRTGEDSALFLPLSTDGPWLHAPGKPVLFRQGLAPALGDERSLSTSFHDNRRTWATIYEQFFTTRGLALIANPHCRRLLALAWYQAGRELAAQSAYRQAATCFRKAVVWRPFRARYYWHFALAWRKVWARPSAPNTELPVPTAEPAVIEPIEAQVVPVAARPAKRQRPWRRPKPAIIQRG